MAAPASKNRAPHASEKSSITGPHSLSWGEHDGTYSTVDRGFLPEDASGDSAADLSMPRRRLCRKIGQSRRGGPSRAYRAQ